VIGCLIISFTRLCGTWKRGTLLLEECSARFISRIRTGARSRSSSTQQPNRFQLFSLVPPFRCMPGREVAACTFRAQIRRNLARRGADREIAWLQVPRAEQPYIQVLEYGLYPNPPVVNSWASQLIPFGRVSSIAQLGRCLQLRKRATSEKDSGR